MSTLEQIYRSTEQTISYASELDERIQLVTEGLTALEGCPPGMEGYTDLYFTSQMEMFAEHYGLPGTPTKENFLIKAKDAVVNVIKKIYAAIAKMFKQIYEFFGGKVADTIAEDIEEASANVNDATKKAEDIKAKISSKDLSPKEKEEYDKRLKEANQIYIVVPAGIASVGDLSTRSTAKDLVGGYTTFVKKIISSIVMQNGKTLGYMRAHRDFVDTLIHTLPSKLIKHEFSEVLGMVGKYNAKVDDIGDFLSHTNPIVRVLEAAEVKTNAVLDENKTSVKLHKIKELSYVKSDDGDSIDIELELDKFKPQLNELESLVKGVKSATKTLRAFSEGSEADAKEVDKLNSKAVLGKVDMTDKVEISVRSKNQDAAILYDYAIKVVGIHSKNMSKVSVGQVKAMTTLLKSTQSLAKQLNEKSKKSVGILGILATSLGMVP